MSSRTFVCLDVGEKRIGVSVADISVRIAIPLTTIEVDGSEIEAIAKIVIEESPEAIILGYPRNQQGEATAQTHYVETFAERLKYLDKKIIFQDESLTSVIAEQRLISYKKPYTKGDIDAQAAVIILEDYLELYHG
ncbi:MAG: Holliday junction resolvase RuvX [Candidatus Saccharimonadaceae bacterium]